MTTFQANQMPILANPMSISAQSEDTGNPICQDWHGLAPDWPIGAGLADWQRIGKGSAITEAIPALNLGTSALYGKVPSPLGGRFQGKLSRPLLQIQC